MDKIRFQKKVGKRLKQIRIKKKLSLSELGYLCGIEKTNLSRIEHGKHSIITYQLKILCDALGISLSDFFEGI